MRRGLAVCLGLALAQGGDGHAQPAALPASLSDARELVTMPALPQAVMRQDMLEHLSAVHEILGLMAEGKLPEAGDLAERSLGFSAVGRHRQHFQALMPQGGEPASGTPGASPGAGMGPGAGMAFGPGRYMPPPMHAIGMGMHQAASAFASVAKQGDLARSLAAFQSVTATCVACHRSYRTR